jgi:hypothetical protein
LQLRSSTYDEPHGGLLENDTVASVQRLQDLQPQQLDYLQAELPGQQQLMNDFPQCGDGDGFDLKLKAPLGYWVD